MCQTSLYDKAVSDKAAYFPPTFYKDGKFTHATAISADLITTANHFYTSTTKRRMDLYCVRQSEVREPGYCDNTRMCHASGRY